MNDTNEKIINQNLNNMNLNADEEDLEDPNGETKYCSNKFSKDSIDRFGDDFLEVILSYLTFNEKVMFESISRQWKRVIYNKQTELVLRREYPLDHPLQEKQNSLNKLLTPIQRRDFMTGYAYHRGFKTIKKESLESLLKKCLFINTIKLECFCDGEDLELIGKHCPHLKSLECYAIAFNEENLTNFGLKYGHRLKLLRISQSIFCDLIIENFFLYCNNLLEFCCDDNLLFINNNPKHLPKLQILKQLNVIESNASKLKIIADKYSNTLREIQINTSLTSDKMLTALSFISKLENLKVLKLHLYTSDENGIALDDNFIEIAKKCTQIEELSITVFRNNMITNKFFSAIGKFFGVKILCLQLYSIDKTLDGNIHCFENLDLKYLRISAKELGDAFFENIHLSVPNLKTIDIECETALTDKTIFSFSKLNKLQQVSLSRIPMSIQMVPDFKDITDDSICQLLDSCPAIKLIRFDTRPKITFKTIDKLIETALKYSKKQMVIESGPMVGGAEGYANIDINSYADQIPENLTLNLIAHHINEFD